MTIMIRKIFLLSILAAFASGCIAQAQKRESSSSQEQSASVEGGTMSITKEQFLTKVVDYEKSPDSWEFLGDKPVLVDFYASWCGPCKMIAPILEELAREYAGEIVIYKVNTESEPDLARAFGIRSIPSLLFIPLEGQPQMSQGAMSKAQFKEAIDKILLGR